MISHTQEQRPDLRRKGLGCGDPKTEGENLQHCVTRCRVRRVHDIIRLSNLITYRLLQDQRGGSQTAAYTQSQIRLANPRSNFRCDAGSARCKLFSQSPVYLNGVVEQCFDLRIKVGYAAHQARSDEFEVSDKHKPDLPDSSK